MLSAIFGSAARARLDLSALRRGRFLARLRPRCRFPDHLRPARIPSARDRVVIGTLAADLLSDLSLLTATFKGLCNAGEAVLAAWLLERWFGRPFTMSDLRAVAGLLTAAGLATAASTTGAAATLTLLHSTAP